MRRCANGVKRMGTYLLPNTCLFSFEIAYDVTDNC